MSSIIEDVAFIKERADEILAQNSFADCDDNGFYACSCGWEGSRYQLNESRLGNLDCPDCGCFLDTVF